MGDDVFEVMFEKHPIDKKDLTVVVNISAQTPKQSIEKSKMPYSLLDEIVEECFGVSDDQPSTSQAGSEIKPMEILEEPLDLTTHSQTRDLVTGVSATITANSKDPEMQAKSNQVCFFQIVFYLQVILF